MTSLDKQHFRTPYPLPWGVLFTALLGPTFFMVMVLWMTSYEAKPSVEERIKLLNAGHLTALENRLKLVKPSGALLDEDRKKEEDFLRRLSESTGWIVKGIKVYPRIAQKQLTPIDFHVKLQGEPYDLPLWVEGLYRQAALCRIDRVRLSSVDEQRIEADFQLRFFSPILSEGSWSKKRKMTSGQQIILRKGLELWDWENYAKHEAYMKPEVFSRKAELERELPKLLIMLHEKGGRASWHPVNGTKYRN